MKQIGVIVLLMLSLCAPAGAAQVSGLYEASLPVSGQDKAERDQVLNRALEQVLIRVSGSRNVAEQPTIVTGLRRASRFVQQFQYRNETTPGADGNGEATRQVLWVQFDPGSLNRLLKQAGMPVWGRERPSTLVWLAIEEGGERRLIGATEQPEVLRVVEDQARVRGVPVLLPLMDLQDQGMLSASDVWGGFRENILRASARYTPDAVLTGRVYALGSGFWELRWKLYLDGESADSSARGEQLESLLRGGMDAAADGLAERYTRLRPEDEPGQLDLLVTEVHSLADYARTKDYLSKLDQISDLQVLQVSVGQVRFRLHADVGPRTLAESIGLGRVLRAADGEGEWAYRLLR